MNEGLHKRIDEVLPEIPGGGGPKRLRLSPTGSPTRRAARRGRTAIRKPPPSGKPGMPFNGSDARCMDVQGEELFRAWREQLDKEFKPRTATERAEVDLLAGDYLRLRRTRCMIAGMLRVKMPVDPESAKSAIYDEHVRLIGEDETSLTALRANAVRRVPPQRAKESAEAMLTYRELVKEFLDAAENREAGATSDTRIAPRGVGDQAVKGRRGSNAPQGEQQDAGTGSARLCELGPLRQLYARIKPALRKLTAGRITSVLLGQAELSTAEREAWIALLEFGTFYRRILMGMAEPYKRRQQWNQQLALRTVPSHLRQLASLQRQEAAVQRAIYARSRQLRMHTSSL